MPDYSKMKNADLEALLKSRNLPTGGKKADMVQRLTTDDEEQKPTGTTEDAAAAAAKPAMLHPEDEIDWDDDEEATGAGTTKSAAEPAASAAQPAEAADIEASKAADVPGDSATEQKENTNGKAQVEEKKEPPPDYTRGLAATNIDEEIERRKRRAAKFGLDIENDEGLKKLERAKKFGESATLGLDEALTERTRKRGRDANDEGARGGDKRRGGRFGGRRGRGNRNGDRRRDNRDARPDIRNRSDGAPTWMSENDRAKAEARKNKWA